MDAEPGQSFQTAATGSNRTASQSVSTSFAGASKLHSTDYAMSEKRIRSLGLSVEEITEYDFQ